MCIFSTHNLIRDPPFSRLDLIVVPQPADLPGEPTCSATSRASSTTRCRPGGYLFLGPSESVAGPPGLFRTVDKKHRLFARGETMRGPGGHGAAARRSAAPQPSRPWATRMPPGEQQGTVAALERVLLDQYAPAWVIVNPQGESVYFSPRTGQLPGAGGRRAERRRREHGAQGAAARPAHRAPQGRADGEDGGPRADRGRDERPASSRSTWWCVRSRSSADEPPVPGGLPGAGSAAVAGRCRARGRLAPGTSTAWCSSSRASCARPRSTCRRRSRRSRPRTRSSSPRTRSCCRPTRSCSRPTRSCRPPRRSCSRSTRSCETINLELSKKVEELDSVNSDLQNLLQSTQIPTLFLDGELRIKRFTEAATQRLPPDRDRRGPSDPGHRAPLRGRHLRRPRGRCCARSPPGSARSRSRTAARAT